MALPIPSRLVNNIMAMKYKISMNVLIYLSFVVFVAIVAAKHNPKYVYPVRERVTIEDSSVSYELWCWKEYDNGHISKRYIGRFVIVGNNQAGERVETSLCGNR